MEPDADIGADAIALLRELLRCDTTNPPGNEGRAVEVLERFFAGSGLSTRVVHSPNGRPSILARSRGPADEPAIVLLSHTDVVDVERDRWSVDPFGGEIVDGRLYGRGALDMKGIAAMHAVAAVHAAAAVAAPSREVIFCSVADEEAGSAEGARWLLDVHPELVGLEPGRPAPEVICEGGFGMTGVGPRPIMLISLGEKTALWIRLRAEGAPGHGSMPPQRTAVGSLAAVVAEVTTPRPPRIEPVVATMLEAIDGAGDGEGALPLLDALQRDTVVATSVHGGYKVNVVPGEATATLDCRLLPSTDPERFVEELREIAAPHGVAVEVESQGRAPVTEPGPLYDLLVRASAALPERPIVTPALMTAFTDLRVFRAHGARGYGWAPLLLSPAQWATIHGHDEHVDVEPFGRAAAVTASVIAEAISAPIPASCP